MQTIQTELKKLILHQPDAHRKLAVNIARHTHPTYATDLYQHIEAPDILFLVGAAALGKSLSAQVCAHLRRTWTLN